MPFIAMEYIDGRPLRELIPHRGLPIESVVRYGIQIAEAVEHAHRHGIIHRDLKSVNVMVSAESQTKVLDFGLASRLPAADMETLTRDGRPLSGELRWPVRSRISRRSCCAAARRTSGVTSGR